MLWLNRCWKVECCPENEVSMHLINSCKICRPKPKMQTCEQRPPGLELCGVACEGSSDEPSGAVIPCKAKMEEAAACGSRAPPSCTAAAAGKCRECGACGACACAYRNAERLCKKCERKRVKKPASAAASPCVKKRRRRLSSSGGGEAQPGPAQSPDAAAVVKPFECPMCHRTYAHYQELTRHSKHCLLTSI